MTLMTNLNPYLWILGARDPEMGAIELLLGMGNWAYAVSKELTLVNQSNAYSAIDVVPHYDMRLKALDSREPVVLIECQFPDRPIRCDGLDWPDIVVDHHRPGASGYGKPPAQYWEASSLGQVVSMLAAAGWLRPDWAKTDGVGMPMKERFRRFWNLEIPHEWTIADWGAGRPGEVVCAGSGADSDLWVYISDYQVARIPSKYRLIAAADHCLAAAYAGQCPGVDPKALREWRIKLRASDQKRSEADILADTARAEAALEAAQSIALAGVQVADLRGQFLPEAPEAACALGVAYLAIVEEPDGRRKVVLGGCGAGTVPGVGPVEAFLHGWAQAQGLNDVYGDPVTGFAGAYLS